MSGYQYREFWRLENAYNDFKDYPSTGPISAYDNYPMKIDMRQVFMIEFTKADGSVIRRYFLADSTLFGFPATKEIKVEE